MRGKKLRTVIGHLSNAGHDFDGRVHVVEGGDTRQESVAHALAAVPAEDEDIVLVHDAVRPCVTETLIQAVFAQTEASGAAIPAIAVADTVKQVDAKKQITATVPRQGLFLAQTPQVFRRDWLSDAYARRGEFGPGITDDAQLVEALGHPVQMARVLVEITAVLDRVDAGLDRDVEPTAAQRMAHHPAAERMRFLNQRLHLVAIEGAVARSVPSP